MVLNKTRFIQIFIAIVWGWVLISLATHAVNTFTYEYLKLNPYNFKVAITILIIAALSFLLYVFILPDEADAPNQVVSRMASVTEFSDNGTIINGGTDSLLIV
jgi:hypothetical protein